MCSKTVKVVIPIILTILWMALIFYFSAQPAGKSADLSESIGERILRVVYPEFSKMDELSRRALVEGIDSFVRKSVHFAEYMVLGFLLMLDLRVLLKKKHFKYTILAILLGFLYACSDEIHQMFVPGRAGMVSDVLLDTGGVICGTLLLVGVSSIWCRRRKNP